MTRSMHSSPPWHSTCSTEVGATSCWIHCSTRIHLCNGDASAPGGDIVYTLICLIAKPAAGSPVPVGASSDSWSVKSKAALLLALVVKRQGQQLWQALQPQLLPLAQQGAVQAEMVGGPFS